MYITQFHLLSLNYYFFPNVQARVTQVVFTHRYSRETISFKSIFYAMHCIVLEVKYFKIQMYNYIICKYTLHRQ